MNTTGVSERKFDGFDCVHNYYLWAVLDHSENDNQIELGIENDLDLPKGPILQKLLANTPDNWE